MSELRGHGRRRGSAPGRARGAVGRVLVPRLGRARRRATVATCASVCIRTSACRGGGSRWSAPTAPLVLVVDHDLPCPDGDAALRRRRARRASSCRCPSRSRRFRVVSTARGVRARRSGRRRSTGSTARAVPVALDLEWASPVRGVPVRDDDALRDLVVGHRHGHDRRRDDRRRLRGPARPLVGRARLVAVPVELDVRPPRRRLVLPRGALDHPRTSSCSRPATRSSPTARSTPADVDRERDVDIDAEKLPTAARQRIGPVAFTTEPVGHAPVLLVAPDGRETRFPRAMCRYTTDDGRAGTGWTEYNWPPGFPA